MRITLTIVTGSEVGRVITTDDATPRTVGSGHDADVPLRDPYLSAVHFAVFCEDGDGVLRDLGSHGGTFVNGAGVMETTLRDGDQVIAGATTFGVRVETHTHDSKAQDRAHEPGAHDPGAVLDELIAGIKPLPGRLARWAMRAEPEVLFAVLDAARDPGLFELIRDSGEVYRALWDEITDDDLEAEAPYLVSFGDDSPLLQTVTEEGWGAGWGVYLTSTASFDEVYDHLRDWLAGEDLSEGPEGPPEPLRFYDPKVLAAALPNFSTEQVTDLFGPVSCFLAESAEIDSLVRYTPAPDAVNVSATRLVLAQGAGDVLAPSFG